MSYITTPLEELQKQAESIERKVTKLNAIYEDYEDLMEKHSELEHRFYELYHKDCIKIKDLTDERNRLKHKLEHKEESLWIKEEQLENYKIALGIAFAIIGFFVAMAVIA
jgi:chromosome segregation ATPase